MNQQEKDEFGKRHPALAGMAHNRDFQAIERPDFAKAAAATATMRKSATDQVDLLEAEALLAKALLAEVGDASLRDWLVQKTVMLSSLNTELETLRKCGINDCRTTMLSIRAGQIAEELHTVAGLMAKTVPTTSPTLRKSAGGFSQGDRVKVTGARHLDLSGRIGTVMTSNTNETSVEFENGSMAIVKTFEVALIT